MPVVSEPVSVVIIGNDMTALTPLASIDNTKTFGGQVVASCTGCVPNKRVLIGDVVGGSLAVLLSSDADLKPAELHVINFPSRDQANAWLDAEKAQLRGKTIYKLPQAPAPAVVAPPAP